MPQGAVTHRTGGEGRARGHSCRWAAGRRGCFHLIVFYMKQEAGPQLKPRTERGCWGLRREEKGVKSPWKMGA